MKNTKQVNLILRSIAFLLLCMGFTLSVIEGQWIWAFTIAAGLFFEVAKLVPLILTVINKRG